MVESHDPRNPREVAPSNGLAIACLVLGIVSIPMSLFVIGGLIGFLGLIFGILHLRRQKQSRGIAIAGSIVSSLGILASLLMVGIVTSFLYQLNALDDHAKWARWEGVVAPDFTVSTLDGETIQLSELKGKRVVVDIWATWCPPCVEEIPHFISLTNEYSPDELVIVGLSDEDPETVREFYDAQGVNYAIAADVSNLGPPYDEVTAIPTTFFIDRNGVIQTVVVGYEDLETLRELALSDDYRGQALSEPRETTSIFLEDISVTEQ